MNRLSQKNLLVGLISSYATLFFCAVVGVWVGLRFNISMGWILLFVAMVFYCGTSAYLRIILTNQQPTEKSSLTSQDLFPRQLRFLRFVIVPLVCGVAVILLHLAHAKKYIIVLLFLGIWIGGDLISIVWSLGRKGREH